MILVRWVDTKGSEGWMDKTEFAVLKPSVVISPGIFINEDEDYLRIAHDFADDEDVIGTVFSKKCVISILPLNVEMKKVNNGSNCNKQVDNNS